ncbi:MAG: 50S ribosomal protein L3 [Patescibacteria group bacterium]
MPFIIGRKIEMTQIFRDDGKVVPVTLVKAEPNVVTAVRSSEKDGYSAVQLGADETRKKINKAQQGHLAGLKSMKTLREFRVDSTDLERGREVSISDFELGMKVDVTGSTKGRGFAGVVKRHGFHGSPATHGHKDQLRMPGSIGSREQAPVARGKRMGGHMGDTQVTVKNLEVVQIDKDNSVIAIKGALPGARGSLLLINSRNGKNLWQK